MKKGKIILPLIASAMLLTLGVTSCSKPQETTTAGGVVNTQTGGAQATTAASGGAQATTTANGGAQQTTEAEEVKITITSANNVKEIQVGETLQLTASVQGVEWSTRNDDVISISNTGLVTALTAGSARITAKKDGCTNGVFNLTVVKAPEKEAKYSLRLEEATHYDPDDFWGMDLSAYGMGIMGPGESPVEDNGGATDDGTSLGWLQAGCKETMKFTSDKVATVELGVTMAYNAEMSLGGVIKVTFNGQEISMENRVVPAPEDASNYYEFHAVSFGNVALIAGENVLEIEMIGQGPNMDKVVFFTNETLDIKAVKAEATPKITLKSAAYEVVAESKVQIESDVTGLTYVSSDPTVATVSATGEVTGVKAGSATITVSKEGMKDATVKITVKAKPITGDNIYEAENATLAGPAQVESKDTANCGKSVGYLSDGASVTFKVTVQEAGAYKLEMNAASGLADWSSWPNVVASEQTLTDALMPTKVNDVAFSIEGKKIPGGNANPSEWFIVDLGTINLNAGENEIVFAFTAQGPNIDYIKLTKVQ